MAPSSCAAYLWLKLFVLWSKRKANTSALPVMCEHAAVVLQKPAKQLDLLAAKNQRATADMQENHNKLTDCILID